ncbi:hypothetical protein GNI_165380 [Gregarina niphandrodes]|uniref:Uncharacterized protein n=1 Tax=Gregarina niphandrodes TaxID=110365 RepID=A0A023AYQ9_GRENI|nr:hypothetical protein GNI_165380 [Gregarina niphandrodes]EZG43588.1 hypothetical protein GNI_165380 [Gregarina niphandrodes]|eukprot:XP_011133180.1 hypothetical protein GNI_165380 [Gregarina niphandrodes]
MITSSDSLVCGSDFVTDCLKIFSECALLLDPGISSLWVEGNLSVLYNGSARPCVNHVMEIEAHEYWMPVIDELNGYSFTLAPSELLYTGNMSDTRLTLVLSEMPFYDGSTATLVENDTYVQLQVGAKYSFAGDYIGHAAHGNPLIWDSTGRGAVSRRHPCFTTPPTIPIACQFNELTASSRLTLDCAWTPVFDALSFIIPGQPLQINLNINMPNQLDGYNLPPLLPPLKNIELRNYHKVLWRPNSHQFRDGINFPVCAHESNSH